MNTELLVSHLSNLNYCSKDIKASAIINNEGTIIAYHSREEFNIETFSPIIHAFFLLGKKSINELPTNALKEIIIKTDKYHIIIDYIDDIGLLVVISTHNLLPDFISHKVEVFKKRIQPTASTDGRLQKRIYLLEFLEIYNKHSNEQIGFLSDISKTGLMIISMELLPMKTPLDIVIKNTFHEDDEANLITLTIEVVWEKPNFNRRLHCYGGEILSISPEDYDNLELFINKKSIDSCVELHRTLTE